VSVRLKTAILVVALLAVSLVSLYLLSRLVLTPSYASLEERFVQTSVEQGLGALDARLNALQSTNYDWSAWDDTYEFVQTGSSTYIESNLLDASLANIGVHVMVFVNEQGDVVYAKAMDAGFGQQIDLPDDLRSHLAPGSLLLAHDNVDDVVYGVLGLAQGPMLISSRPVVTSAEEGPIEGTLLMGVYIDDIFVAEMEETTRHSLSLDPSAVSQPMQSGGNDGPGVAASDIEVTPMGGNTIEGSTTLFDIYGQPVAQLTVTQDRSLYAEGQRTLRYFLVVIAVGGIALALLFVALLDRTMLRRLSRLASQVQVFGQTGTFAGHVSVAGDDEIANLAGVINETFSALSQSHANLADAHRNLEQTAGELKRTDQELRVTANQLRRLTRHLQTIREDERVLVANEIHDHVGQGLTALKMDLSALEKSAARGDVPTPAFLQRMTELLNSLLETVRRLSSGLHPSMLEDLGLAEAIEWHLEEFGKGRAIKTTLKIQGPVGSVEASRALALFRILQEALLVSSEDATVTEVTVSLTIENRYALLAIQDNGVAVVEADALTRREMGLSIIRERTEVFGGGVTIAGSQESGTTVVAQVPL
jgi:sensor domain CHASE-containing protein